MKRLYNSYYNRDRIKTMWINLKKNLSSEKEKNKIDMEIEYSLWALVVVFLATLESIITESIEPFSFSREGSFFVFSFHGVCKKNLHGDWRDWEKNRKSLFTST